MSLTKILGIAGIIGITTLLPIRASSQDIKKEENYRVVFEKAVPKEDFFTENFTEYLDSLKYKKEQKDRFIFNGIKNDKMMVTAPYPLNNVLLFAHRFYLKGMSNNFLCIELKSFEEKGKGVVTNYDVSGVNTFSSNGEQELYSQMYLLFKIDIAQKKGLKEAGVLKQAKKAYFQNFEN